MPGIKCNYCGIEATKMCPDCDVPVCHMHRDKRGACAAHSAPAAPVAVPEPEPVAEAEPEAEPEPEAPKRRTRRRRRSGV